MTGEGVMRRMMMAAVLGLGLAACGAADEPEATPGVEAPAAAEETKPEADAPEAAADPTETARGEAEAFVRTLYTRMDDADFAPLDPAVAGQVFTAEVAGMLEAARAWPDEGLHPALEADPVCLCQDPHGLTLREVSVVEASADRAAVRARFDFGKADDAESARAPLFILRREADGWRVDDIRTDDGFSFRRTLAE
ncbi:DUF3828 domain-containing protein [Brevundimonas abyssalis]|jgi:hypothetical protein|nr:DUF3828 domain-containing protein [Brevundimonas abyssalis]